MDSAINIRKALKSDSEAVWQILAPAIAAGETLAFAPDSSKVDMLNFWLGDDKDSYVAEWQGKVVGTFFIKPNQPGLGAHVANAGYVTAADQGGKGIGGTMCKWSLTEAKRLGYQSMQFNIVIKSNDRAVKLWQKLGFQIVGEIPEAFNHQQYGLINAYVMWQKL